MDNSHVQIILTQQAQIDGDWHLDADGQVNVQGDVIYKTHINQLHVQFGTVSGNFSRSGMPARNPRLTTLTGFPRKVGGSVSVARSRIKDLHHAPNQVSGSFYVYHCDNLTTLQGAPRWVGGNMLAYKCALTSLAGAPFVVKGTFDVSHNPLENYDHLPEHCAELVLPYVPDAPMLKLLMYPKVILHDAPEQVKQILDNHAGKGKSAAIACAAELVRAGFKGNARW